MTQNVPTLGRIVHVLTDPTFNNGSDVCPAVITRVWSEGHSNVFGEFYTVNYRLLPDALPSDREWRTSARLFADRTGAEQALQYQAEANSDSNAGGSHAANASLRSSGMFAFWPPR